MSLRPSRPLAGVTASQLWANSLDAGELIDKLDADNQKALADLVRVNMWLADLHSSRPPALVAKRLPKAPVNVEHKAKPAWRWQDARATWYGHR